MQTMQISKTSLVFSSVLAGVACGMLATPALAWSWPWQDSSSATSQTSSDATNAPAGDAAGASSNAKAVATATPAIRRKAGPAMVLGIIENIDAPNHRFILRTSAGKSESFRLAKSSVILNHHRKLTLSALKAGEHVSVRCRHRGDAVRVYVLEDKKA